MLIILDIEMVKYLLLLSLCKIWICILAVELAFPHLNFAVFLLHQLDQILILIHKMGILGQQQLYFLLEVIDFLSLADLEQQLFIHCHQLRLKLTHSLSPILGAVVGEIRVSVARRGILIGARAWVSRVALIGRIVLAVPEVADRAASHLNFYVKNIANL